MKWICVFALVVLTSCGPLGRNNYAIGAVRSVAGSNAQNELPGTGPFVGWALAGLEEQSSDRLLLNVFERGAASAMVHIGTNGSRITWVSAEAISVTLEDGVVIATRGLGGDLMGTEAPVKGAGFRIASNYLRTHDFLNGLGQIVHREFRCETFFWKDETLEISARSYETKAYREVCEGEQNRFTNTYWLTPNGTIQQTRQWISPEVGHIGYQRL